MLKWRHFSKIEKALIVFAAFTTLSVLAYGLNYRFHGEPVKESVPSIGAITHQKNDTRYRPFDSFAWAPSERAQSIRTGDSVFAGENSAAQVSLREGGDVVIGANSLVAFNKINKERMANLLQGNFKIAVKGQAKIAIRGKVTKISGKNSEIQLFTGSDLKPKLRVLSGEATVRLDDREPPLEVKAGEVVEVPTLTKEELAAIAPVPVEPQILEVLNPDPLLAENTASGEVLSQPVAKPEIPPPVARADFPEPPSLIDDEMLKSVVMTKVEPVPTVVQPEVKIERPVEKVPVKVRKIASEERPTPQSVPESKPTPMQAPLMPEVKVQQPPPAIRAPEADSRSLIVKDFWVWLGMGVNYTSNTQSVQGFSNIEYGKIRGPSMMVKAGFFASDRFGVDLGYKTTPGEAKSSPSLSVRNGAYTWQTMSAEGLYRSERDLSKTTEWVWRLGLQQHQFPFMVPESSSVINVTESSMTNISLGFEYKRKIRERLRFEWLMRYQRPISQSSGAGAAFSIAPQFAFDGSLGSAYEIRENLFLGVYWYGQYQKFDFNYRDNGALNFSGQQSLFFSNFDLRLGWEF